MTPTETQAFNQMRDALALLEEVSHCFTREDDLPDNLLPRIDAALAAAKEVQPQAQVNVPQHRWGPDGERCIKCRDKDWMGGPCSVSDSEFDALQPVPEIAHPQASEPQAQVEAIGTVTVVPDQGFSEVTWSKQLQLPAGRHSLYTHPQASEPAFTPDWSMLEATQESLREHMAMVKASEPAGWKLVPVEPTPEMLYAIQDGCDILPPRGKRVWSAMLAAAPEATTPSKE